jgi:streptomycin 6-kinase
MIAVPRDFAESTIAREGLAGREWIAALPRTVEALCAQWGLVVDGSPMHGYLGLVVPVRRGSELFVLKVSWIDESYSGEAAALAAWGGRGAVLLLEADMWRGAMLMERLDYTRSLNDLGIEEALGIAGRLVRRLAIPAPAGLRSLRGWAAEVADNLPKRWEQFGRPMPRRFMERTRRLAVQLGEACSGKLLVNFDLHHADVLAGSREPWLAVDPMVLVGQPEFATGQLLWTRLEDIQAHGGLDRQFRVLTEAAELDPALALDWLLVRCVDYWLWGLSVGLTYDPARCEIIVDWLLGN